MSVIIKGGNSVDLATVKPASTAAVATDPALVVQISPNSPASSVSGTVTANIGTSGSLALDTTLTGGTQKAIVRGGAKGSTTAGDVTSTNVDANTQALDVSVKGTPTITVANASLAVTGTFFQATQPVSAASLPLPTGASTETTLTAISGKLPATLGQKAMAAALAVSIASDQSAIPVSGTVTANAGSGTMAVSAASLPLPSGAATEVSLVKVTNTQGSTTSGQSGPLEQAAVTTAAPSYITGQTSPLSLTTNGSLRTDNSTVGGTAVVTAGVAGLQALGGAAAAGAAVSGNPLLMGASDGTNAQTLRTAATFPAGTEQGLIVRPLPTIDSVTTLTALGAINAAATLTVNGNASFGMQLAAGTLIGTLVPEVSVDGGTTWIQTQFFDATTQSLATSLVFTAANAATTRMIVAMGGVGQVRVRVSAFTSGTANATVRASKASSPIVYSVNVDGSKATYSAAIIGLIPAATPTDIFTITGSATKTVRITRVSFSATQTTGGAFNVQLVKRSTANTVGTSTAPIRVSHDSADPAATATVLAYTANPTLGTLVGPLRAVKGVAAAATGSPIEQIWDFGIRDSAKKGILRGITEVIAVNLNATTLTGGSVNLNLEWIEE